MEDRILATLGDIIIQGWPTDKQELPTEIKQYWPYRDELVAHNGIIYRGTRVVIPTSMRQEMLQKIHVAHKGTDGCLKMAKDTIYWPSIYNDLKYICET